MHLLIQEFNLSSTGDKATAAEESADEAGAAGAEDDDETAAIGVDGAEADKEAPDEVYTRSFVFVNLSIGIILKENCFFNTIPLRVFLTLRSIFVMLHWWLHQLPFFHLP
jgi:hypothetical protein